MVACLVYTISLLKTLIQINVRIINLREVGVSLIKKEIGNIFSAHTIIIWITDMDSNTFFRIAIGLLNSCQSSNAIDQQ